MWLLLALLVTAPALVGGVHTTTMLVLTGLGLLALVAVLVHRVTNFSFSHLPSFAFVLAGVALYSLVRLVPVWHGLGSLLVPFTFGAMARAGQQGWHPWTTDVPGELFGVFRYLSHLGVFLLAFEVGRRDSRTRALLWAMGALAVFFALALLVHKIFGLTRIFGIYQPVHTHYYLPFPNENQSAGYYLLHFFILLGLAFYSKSAWRINVAALGAIILFIVVVMAGSRAANTVLILGLIAFLVLGYAKVRTRKLKWSGMAGWIVVFVFLLVVLFVINGYLVDYLTSFDTRHELKLTVWRNTLTMIGDNWVAGLGTWSYPRTITHYLHDPNWRALPTFAENVVLQRLAEWGVPFGTAVLGVLLFMAARGLRYMNWSWKNVGLVVGVAAVLVQNLFDFGLEFPGLAWPVLTVLALLHRKTSRDDRLLRHRWRGMSPVVVASVAFLAFLVLGPWISSHWYAEVDATVVKAIEKDDTRTLERVVDRESWLHPTDYVLALGRGWAAFRKGRRAEALRWLDQALWLFPEHHVPHYLLARVFASTGRLAQAASEYRQALVHGLKPTASVVARMRRMLGRHFSSAVPWADPHTLARIYPYLTEGERDEACRRFVAMGRGHVFGCLRRLVRRAYEKGEYGTLRRYLAEWQSAGGGTQEIVAFRVAVLLRKGRYDDALALLSKTRDLHSALRYVQALILLKKGDVARAKGILRSLVDAPGMTPYTRWLASQKLLSLGAGQEEALDYISGTGEPPALEDVEERIYAILLPIFGETLKKSNNFK